MSHSLEGKVGCCHWRHAGNRLHRRLDVSIANPVVDAHAPLSKITEERVDTMIRTNLKGVRFTLQSAVPLLSSGGAIILIGPDRFRGAAGGDEHLRRHQGGLRRHGPRSIPGSEGHECPHQHPESGSCRHAVANTMAQMHSMGSRLKAAVASLMRVTWGSVEIRDSGAHNQSRTRFRLRRHCAIFFQIWTVGVLPRVACRPSVLPSRSAFPASR